MNREKPIRFKVKYGFSKSEQVSVDAGGELEKVIYAWAEHLPVTVGGVMIHGKHIRAIEPDYHYYTGWYPNYEPSNGDDWAQIERDCPDFDGYLSAYVNRVRSLSEAHRADEIGRGEPIELPQKNTQVSSYAQVVLDK